jgi:hypothetical protein
MKLPATRLALLACILLLTAPVNRAAQLVLVLRTNETSWDVLEAEKVAINGKVKLRTGAARTEQVQPGEYKKLPAEQILRAGILRRHRGGYMVRKDSAGWAPIAPDGATVKSATSYAALWSSATVAVQKERNAKGMTQVPAADVFAVFPASDRGTGIVEFWADPGNFRGVGEKDEVAAFDERMSLLVSVASWVTGAPAEKLKKSLLTEMQTSNQRLSSGIAHFSDLEHGLLYADVSDKAYPNDEAQKKARDALREKKAWLDRRIAILKAFDKGQLWDEFIDKYVDFARYENSFEQLRKLRDNALRESTVQHKNDGIKQREAGRYALALSEFKLAQLRSPGDREIEDLIQDVSVEDERSHAALVKQETKLTSALQVKVTRHLNAAQNYIDDKNYSGDIGEKWKAAEDEIRQAEALDKDSYRILLTRAFLLRAQNKLLDALKFLDLYLRRVSADKDVEDGERLRGQITYDLASQKEKRKAATEKAEADGDYVQARENAQAGVELDPSNLYFLLHAGRGNAILRNRPVASNQFAEYLRLSQVSGGDEKQRADVYGYVTALNTDIPEPEGKPNWYSGYKSPPDLFYCPISLMPNVHVDAVKASRKQTTAFHWGGDQLTEVYTQNLQNGQHDVRIHFEYFKDRGMVRRVAEGNEDPFAGKEDQPMPRLTPKGPVGPAPGDYVVLLDHPTVDPVMVERLTGKRVATIVAGNGYFHPFVWSGVCRFLAEYDDQGRVKSALRLDKSDQEPRVLDFRWEGLRLIEIAERGGQGYRRTMTYVGGKLTQEAVSNRGKNTKIEYKYKGDQLVEANCGDDASVEGRSRHVTFR